MHYSRDQLVGEVIRLLYCMKKLDQKREEELQEFKLQ